MLFGYARVSTVEQNEARQIAALQQLGVETENVYIDKQSGKDANRPKLKELLDDVCRGDTVVTDSISRIARNTKDLLSIVECQRQYEIVRKGRRNFVVFRRGCG